MKKSITYYIAVLCFSVFGVSSCIEPFTPSGTGGSETHLVIDGFLNIGTDSNYITLTKTRPLQDDSPYEKVRYATVSVVSEEGKVYNYVDRQDGTYVLAPQVFNENTRYQLRVRTYEGKQYESDFVSVSKTPDIDSVTYYVDNQLGTVVINVNTHDPANETWFYRWNYEETYKYSTPHFSSIVWTGSGRNIVPRNERIDLCWKTETSKHILLGSTIKQTSSSVLSLPVSNTPISTNKFLEGYSILVRQYGLTHEAFEYWTTLAKTTQGTGSLFDPLPSLVTGNIKCITNQDELVFGYFSAGEEKTKRLFISQRLGNYLVCPLPMDTVSIFDPRFPVILESSLLIDFTDESQREVYTTIPICADCRLKGGNTTKPSFWP